MKNSPEWGYLTKMLKFLFNLLGWKLKGEVPYDLPKALIIVCPHASWVDFPIGLMARAKIGRNIHFWGKKELFKPPFGFLFRSLGGFPVDRSKNNNLVDAIVDIFNSHDQFYGALAPEGTRKNVETLKTGFYYIADKAKVPLIFVGFDYPNKQIILNKPFYTSGDFEKDKIVIAEFFNSIAGVKKDWIKNYLNSTIS